MGGELFGLGAFTMTSVGFLRPFGAEAKPPSDTHDCVIAKCVAAPITKTESESKPDHNTFNLDETG